jgi:two-component system, sensor histidine kinase and response regulator
MALVHQRADAPEVMDASDVGPVDGLNATDGLRRVAGDVQLYLRLLKLFVDGHGEAAETIRNSLSAGDGVTAEREAHSLKGVAGNIGATTVHAAAADLEKAIRLRAQTDQIESLRQKLAQVLEPLVASLKSFLACNEQDTVPVATSADPQELDGAIAKLTALLEQSDPAAASLVGSVRCLFTRETFEAFEHLVNGYAFDGAIESLRSAAAARRLTP